MDKAQILNLLQNSGLNVKGMDSDFLYFEDPSCIFPVFDQILEIAWIVILMLTVLLLVGWAVLYIKNGANINTVFNNAKSLILVFAVLSVVKPIVNVVYGDNLFAKGCEIKSVSLSSVNELLEMREKQLKKSDEAMLYETFNVVDSGAKISPYEDDTNN